MAQLAAALPYITAASTFIGVASTVQQGRNQQKLLNYQAEQRDADAKAAQAESQREAINERKKAQNLMSRARAVAGASGAGSSDPTVTNILTDIETQGEVNALNALYSGNVTASGLRSGAASARAEGQAYRSASYLDAASTGLDTASGLRSGAASARAEGQAYRSASYLDAASTGLDGATSWYSKYGGKKVA